MKPKQKPASQPRMDFPKEIFEPLSPYNWDFRTIPDWLLRDAIEDEYVRSWPEFRAVATAWLEKIIDGRTIRDHLIEANSKNKNFPEKVWEALPKGEWHHELFGLEDDCYYPAPLTWMLEKGIIQKSRPMETRIITVRPGVSLKIDFEEIQKKAFLSGLVLVRPMNKQLLEHVSLMLATPGGEESYGYHLKIDFDGHRNEELVDAFAFWLKEEAKKKRKIKVHGRASSPKWHRLKQLAAKRLSDSGLNFKDAKRTIAEREKAVPMVDYNSVLPKYNSPGAWHGAIKEANEMVEKMKQNYHLEGWELL